MTTVQHEEGVFLGGTRIKNPPANAGDAKGSGSIPGSGRVAYNRACSTHSKQACWARSRPPEPRRGITAGHRARLLSSMCWCCSHSSLPLPIPRSVEVMKSPSNILINKVNEQTVSCREIGRGYFLSQKGRHISFWIYGLTWPNHAHLSLELRVDCCTKQLLLILERWKKKSI